MSERARHKAVHCIAVMLREVVQCGVHSLTGWENEWSSMLWCGERCSGNDTVMYERVAQGEKRGACLWAKQRTHTHNRRTILLDTLQWSYMHGQFQLVGSVSIRPTIAALVQ